MIENYRISRRSFLQFSWLTGAALLTGCRPEVSPFLEKKRPGTVRVAVVGDYGNPGMIGDKVANAAKVWDPDVVATLGDNIHQNGDPKMFAADVRDRYGWAMEKGILVLVEGNHDQLGWPADAIPLLQQPELSYLNNQRYFHWPIDRGLVDLFVLNSDPGEPDGRTWDSIQGRWLQDKLSISQANYKLVLMHESPFSSCQFGSQKELQWPFKKWGATAVLAGHCHFYQLMIIDGFPYFVNGLGGSPEKSEFLTPVPGSETQYNDDWGLMLIEADTSRINFRFVTIGGRVIDSYSIFSN